MNIKQINKLKQFHNRLSLVQTATASKSVEFALSHEQSSVSRNDFETSSADRLSRYDVLAPKISIASANGRRIVSQMIERVLGSAGYAVNRTAVDVNQFDEAPSLYEVDGAYIFFDQTSDYEAFQAVCRMAASFGDGRRRVSLVFGFSNDWSDDSLEQAGCCAAPNFDRIIVRENQEFDRLRSGETAHLLHQGVKSAVPEIDCRIISSEDEALRREVTRLREDDILVCFYENSEIVREILQRCEAVPILKFKKTNQRPTFN